MTVTQPIRRASDPTPNAIGKVAASSRRSPRSAAPAGSPGERVCPTPPCTGSCRDLVSVGWAREDGGVATCSGHGFSPSPGAPPTKPPWCGSRTPTLQELSDRTGHAVHFALRTGDEAVYIDKIEGSRAYQMRSRVGLAIPLHCTAIGKAVLAALPDERCARFSPAQACPAAQATPSPRSTHMLRHLEVVRKRGYSLDDEENELSIRCIGAAVRDHSGIAIGGVSLSMLAFELDPHRSAPSARW